MPSAKRAQALAALEDLDAGIDERLRSAATLVSSLRAARLTAALRAAQAILQGAP
jgi:hypothetical protein